VGLCGIAGSHERVVSLLHAVDRLAWGEEMLLAVACVAVLAGAQAWWTSWLLVSRERRRARAAQRRSA
jgi:hypothetical protein